MNDSGRKEDKINKKKENILKIFLLLLVVLSCCSMNELSYADNDVSLSDVIRMAEQGDIDSIRKLGVMYLNGDKVSKNTDNAIKLFRNAAERGDAKSQYNLGTIYSYGDGIVQDNEKAFAWYKKAAEQGLALAQYNLAILYYKGIGVLQDKEEALRWVQKAVKQDLANAQNFLAFIYRTGECVPKNPNEAIKLYKKAATQGLTPSQYNLAVMYEKGEGVTQNIKEAIRWYTKAAKQGHKKAQEKLKQIHATQSTLATEYNRSVKDKPFPMSQENLEKLARKVEKKFKSLVPTPLNNMEELVTAAYKNTIEEQFGYSFDKTLRSVILFYRDGLPWFTMNPAISYVLDDPQNALAKNFISQRTFDILDTGRKAKGVITKSEEQFLEAVIECQNLQYGICTPQALINVLRNRKMLPIVREDDQGLYLAQLEYELGSKYNTYDIGMNNLITKPDGSKINTNGMFSIPRDSSYQFIVNKKQLAISKRYTEMIEEEKITLFQ